ncbi:hypothetical protein [Pseudoalteromonas rubra]|uniref:hypothetical protein n=1 Tax=Pseudoalteromonas rubra TaxID=43658 RepID=UPI002DBA27B9|nr:hypothetical protein [Pseudoalteromonas rubra]
MAFCTNLNWLAEREAGGAELWLAEPEYIAMEGLLHQSKLAGLSVEGLAGFYLFQLPSKKDLPDCLVVDTK